MVGEWSCLERTARAWVRGLVVLRAALEVGMPPERGGVGKGASLEVWVGVPMGSCCEARCLW